MAGIDVLIRGAKGVGGSGNPWFYGDVAIAGDRIAAVAPAGRIDPASAGEGVEADGMVVCPGFIDIQSHSIIPLMRDGRWANARVERVAIDGSEWTLKDFSSRPLAVRNTLGRFLLRRELSALRRLEGIRGVPTEAFRLDAHAIAARYLPGGSSWGAVLRPFSR